MNQIRKERRHRQYCTREVWCTLYRLKGDKGETINVGNRKRAH